VIVIEPATRSARLDEAALAALGGKGRSLYELGRLGDLRVPPWFAVAADVFVGAVAEAGIGDDIAAIVEQLEASGPDREAVSAAHRALQPLVARLSASEAARTAIGDAYDALGAVGDRGYVAVRSSALDEDGAVRSFAGCLDTALFVRGRDAVVDAVVACWRSAFSERSLAYRAANGALGGAESAAGRPGIAVAVVVQTMVEGQVSGVLFSADPATGNRDRAVVTATWGLGEGVVSGRLACDTFVVGGRGGTPTVLERDVVLKDSRVVRNADGGAGTREVSVDPARRCAPTLDDATLAELVRLGWTIEEAYGRPVDVEWTTNDDGVWLLQARPITTAVAPEKSPVGASAGAARLWDNSNIIESYSGVTTPLTYSFARRAYATVYRQAFDLLGVPQRELAANQATFEQMIGLLRGRIYYNLESWYRALQFLPAYKFNAEFMEQMMGVGDSTGTADGFDVAGGGRSSRWRRYAVELPRLGASVVRMTSRFARANRLVDEFYDHFAEAYADLWERDLEQMSFDGLVETYLEAERRILDHWQAPIVNDILAMIYFGSLRKVLARVGLGESSLQNDLLCGEGGLESTEPTRDLLRIMSDVRRDPTLCAVLEAQSPAAIRERVRRDEAFGWLRVRLVQHVDRFGDRCIDELKLEEPTLRDDDTFLYAALKGYLAAPPVTVDEMVAREQELRAAAEAHARATIGRNPVARRLFSFVLSGARRHVKNRENLRFARTRAFGLIRRLALAMGARLTEAGLLDQVDDVFYLEVGELVGFARGTATTANLRGLVAARRAEFADYRDAADLPERFTTRGAVYLDPSVAGTGPAEAADARRADTGDVLRGTGASPGVVTAPARLVRDPRTASLAGDVLVANRTDPGWVPLFPSAAAVVVERGSVLSHSAIVAREFGIPCVVGIRNALSTLQDGQPVEVNGSTGTVRVVET